MQKQRLSRELVKIAKSPPKGISLSSRDDKMNVLDGTIVGPEKSPYADGIFKIEVIIPENYPFRPPSIKFITKIYHPNIDEVGRICLDLIKMPPIGNWRPTIGVEGLVIAVRMLLENPNADDPLMVEIAEEYKNDNKEYLRKAKLFTDRYANVDDYLS